MSVGPDFSFFLPVGHIKSIKKNYNKKSPTCGQHYWNSPAENSHFQSVLEASCSRYFQAEMNYWNFPLHYFHLEMGGWARISAECIWVFLNIVCRDQQTIIADLMLFVSLIGLGFFLPTWNTVSQKAHIPSTVLGTLGSNAMPYPYKGQGLIQKVCPTCALGALLIILLM